jgi:CHRD domain
MRRGSVAFTFAVVAAVIVTAMVRAGGGGGHDDHHGRADRLSGYQENPDISSAARGSVTIDIDDDAREITYELRYQGLEGTVQQAHIHFGKVAVNGGVTLFLCGTANSPGPAGTPTCPDDGGVEAVVTRTVGADQILAPGVSPTNAVGQGIEAGNFEEFAAALRRGNTYANVHSSKWPGGEIRAQISPRNAKH